MQYIIYAPVSRRVIDAALLLDDGRSVIGLYSGETLQSLRRRYPDAILSQQVGVRNDYEGSIGHTPERCSADQFDCALSAVSPADWRYSERGESFKTRAVLAAPLAVVYARVADTYWCFRAAAGIEHDDVMRRVEAQLWAAATVL